MKIIQFSSCIIRYKLDYNWIQSILLIPAPIMDFLFTSGINNLSEFCQTNGFFNLHQFSSVLVSKMFIDSSISNFATVDCLWMKCSHRDSNFRWKFTELIVLGPFFVNSGIVMGPMVSLTCTHFRLFSFQKISKIQTCRKCGHC